MLATARKFCVLGGGCGHHPGVVDLTRRDISLPTLFSNSDAIRKPCSAASAEHAFVTNTESLSRCYAGEQVLIARLVGCNPLEASDVSNVGSVHVKIRCFRLNTKSPPHKLHQNNAPPKFSDIVANIKKRTVFACIKPGSVFSRVDVLPKYFEAAQIVMKAPKENVMMVLKANGIPFNSKWPKKSSLSCFFVTKILLPHPLVAHW